MIKQLEGKNIKGATFNDELAPITIFVGANGANKSTRIDALYLALLGYHPRLGKKNESIFRLATGQKMSVSLTMEDGVIFQSFEKLGDTVKQLRRLTPAGMAQFPPIMLDPKVYFELSPNKRVSLVSSLCKADTSTFTSASIIAEVKNITLEKNSDHSEAAIKTIVGLLSQIEAEEGQAWIEEAVDSLKTEISETSASIKRMTGVIQGSEELKALFAEKEKASPVVERRLREARTMLAAMLETKGKLESTIEQIKSQTHRRNSLALIKQPSGVNVASLKREQEEIQTLLDCYKSGTEQVIKNHSDENAKLSALCGTESRLKEQIESIESEITGIGEIDCCPKCKTEGEKFKPRLLKSMREEIAKVKIELAAVSKQITEQRKVVNQAGSALTESRQKDAAMEAKRARLREIGTTLQANQKNISAYESAQSELKNMQDLGSEADAQSKADDHWGRLRAHQQVIADLDTEYKKVIQERADASRQLQAIEQAEKLDAQLAVAKQAAEILREKLSGVVSNAFQPLLKTANKIAGTIMRDPLLYQNNELGILRNGHWISSETFCGAEEAVTYAGLCVALAMNDSRRIVIMDELTRIIGMENKSKLMQGIIELVKAGDIKQFVGVDGDPAAYNKMRGAAGGLMKIIEV